MDVIRNKEVAIAQSMATLTLLGEYAGLEAIYLFRTAPQECEGPPDSGEPAALVMGQTTVGAECMGHGSMSFFRR